MQAELNGKVELGPVDGYTVLNRLDTLQGG